MKLKELIERVDKCECNTRDCDPEFILESLGVTNIDTCERHFDNKLFNSRVAMYYLSGSEYSENTLSTIVLMLDDAPIAVITEGYENNRKTQAVGKYVSAEAGSKLARLIADCILGLDGPYEIVDLDEEMGDGYPITTLDDIRLYYTVIYQGVLQEVHLADGDDECEDPEVFIERNGSKQALIIKDVLMLYHVTPQ